MTNLSKAHEKTYNQMIAVYRKNDFIKAAQLCDIILNAVPDHIPTLTYLASTYEKRNQFTAAITTLEKLTVLDPTQYSHFSNLGLLYQNINEYAKAKDFLIKALAIKPNSPSALLNLGFIAYDTALFDEAETSYRKIFVLKPDWARPHYNLALLLLTLGRYEEGWKEFEYRLNSPEWTYLNRNHQFPLWRGENLRNKTLLVYSEQGFGDMFQFVRFLSLIKRPDNYIVIEVHPPIYDLFKNIPFIDKVIKINDPLPPFDYHVSLLSIPFVTKTTTEHSEILPYLASSPSKKRHWQKELATIKKRKVGLCWSGNPENKINNRRSCELKKMLPYYLSPDIQFINLNKDCSEEDKLLLQENKVLNYFDTINNFDDTAALIENLDLVISIDTSVSHLAAALGKPVFLMLYHFPEWRYLLAPHHTPWYPTMKLFRQQSRGDWDGVFVAIQDELKLWLQ